MSLIPLVYYEYADELSELASITELQLVSLLTFGIAFSEAIRLKLGITIFGQRDYESKQVSALAWGGLAVGIDIPDIIRISRIGMAPNPLFVTR